jgi:uncharacterized protein YecT (DUF1311 family)
MQILPRRSLLLALGSLGLLFCQSQGAAAQGCDRSSSTQSDLNDCAAKAAAGSARRLQKLLAEIASRVDSTRAVGLREVQARWVRYRDGQCKWEADAFTGGSVQPMEYSYCIAGLTEERIAGLKEELCEGSGMTGPCAASRKYDLSPASRARFRR